MEIIAATIKLYLECVEIAKTHACQYTYIPLLTAIYYYAIWMSAIIYNYVMLERSKYLKSVRLPKVSKLDLQLFQTFNVELTKHLCQRILEGSTVTGWTNIAHTIVLLWFLVRRSTWMRTLEILCFNRHSVNV